MGAPCTTNYTSWTVAAAVGNPITAAVITQLRTAINREKTRRGAAQLSFTTIAAGGAGSITTGIFNEVKNGINGIRAFTWTYSYAVGSSIYSAYITELRQKMNDLEDDCICNCNYCTCNCNYCTCNCNYACTCNCNYSYSDINLKENIKYI